MSNELPDDRPVQLTPSAEPPAYAEARFVLRDNPAEPRVWGLDSNSLVRPEDAGAILVTGSHGGLLGGRPESAIGVRAPAISLTADCDRPPATG